MCRTLHESVCTQASAFRDRYESVGLGGLASLVTSIGLFAYAVLQETGAGYILNVMSGGKTPVWTGILPVISAYVFKSGLRAVRITNVFQAVLMFIVAWTVGIYVANEFTRISGNKSERLQQVCNMFWGRPGVISG